jgi:hypothetical protein
MLVFQEVKNLNRIGLICAMCDANKMVQCIVTPKSSVVLTAGMQVWPSVYVGDVRCKGRALATSMMAHFFTDILSCHEIDQSNTITQLQKANELAHCSWFQKRCVLIMPTFYNKKRWHR